MKLAWSINNGHDKFALFMRSKYFNNSGEQVQSYRASTIWAGIKNVMDEVNCRSQWVIGNGEIVDIWRHNWLATQFLKERLQLSRTTLHGLGAKVQCLIGDGCILIPPDLAELIHSAGMSTDNVLKGDDCEADYLVWCMVSFL
ncbi:hypothetical protein FRX31_020999 [Thalictrum thalictroides]|uniref:Uncharacterized protein n=1 Tax=Thalictrum thalictroides TaxID=46969 RepID=A0A7J6VX57_THATH|nr:hypothetical protein FRX31_020999 [Thalictrum thalictroides]